MFIEVQTNRVNRLSVVSVRVNRKTKEALKRAGVDISNEVRVFLEDLAWKAQLGEKMKKLDELVSSLPSAKKGFGSKSVREDRESH